jgi:hypothetical protein
MRQLRRPRATRRGDVPAALFVMGIGLQTLLTLFPFDAPTMAGAIKDDRAGAIADQATALRVAGEDLVLCGRSSSRRSRC